MTEQYTLFPELRTFHQGRGGICVEGPWSKCGRDETQRMFLNPMSLDGFDHKPISLRTVTVLARSCIGHA